MSSLREQFEAWWMSQCKGFEKSLAWEAYQAGHAVNAELLEALESMLGAVETM